MGKIKINEAEGCFKVMINKLSSIYTGWEVLKTDVNLLEYNITRSEKPVLLKTNAITYIVRKSIG